MLRVAAHVLYAATQHWGAEPFFPDALYLLPDRQWLFREFCPALRRYLEQLRVAGYQPGCNDCDNFALVSLGFASVLHSRSTRADAGLGIAEFWYHQDPTRRARGHSILAAVVPALDATLQVIYLEPQTQEQIKLSLAQEHSCYFARFC